MRMTGPWSLETATRFILETPVPLRLSCRTPQDRPWIVTLWTTVACSVEATDPFRLLCATAAGSRVLRYLEADPTVAFDLSTNRRPYRGVRGWGRAQIAADADKSLLRGMLLRYTQGMDGPLARRLLDDQREECRIEVEIAHLHSWDHRSGSSE
ncbi:UNVERIFIED_CONTAM: hypothetical protein BEN50_15480 [Euhalothece sp. KZN 001]|jgi:Pyridoxamine 5''-phosphate oxidase.